MKLLVISCAGLDSELQQKFGKAEFWKKLRTSQVSTVFPAVTCTVQASFRTALPPAAHGMTANGLFDRTLKKAFFWEQASTLYSGERIWEIFRKNGGTVGQLCWQQSLGTDSDIILSPAPIHKHHGGMIQDFFSVPGGLYNQLCSTIGKKFNLYSYWGPFVSHKSTHWITEAAIEMLKGGTAADIQLVYLPHLDYSLQKFGPASEKAALAFAELERDLAKLANFAEQYKYDLLIFGDYSVGPANSAIFPNRILRNSKLFAVREVRGMLYPDLHTSAAFALADHQAAHIYVNDKENIYRVKELFSRTEGIRRVLTKGDPDYIESSSSGEIILEAAPGFWFAYPWWNKTSEQPEYASHVDIHSKPGFDPCELFLALWPPMSISTDTSKVKGTHGITDSPVFWGTTLDLGEVKSIISGAEKLRNHIS